jgi:hypothetical protein
MARQASRRRAVAAPTPKQPTNPEDWVTAQQYVAQHSMLATRWAIRWAILHRAENGLDAADAVRKVGNRYLIHRSRFSAWRLGEQPVATEVSP